LAILFIFLKKEYIVSIGRLLSDSCGLVQKLIIMPKIKTSRVKYPEGWELIEPTLRDLEANMREGINFLLVVLFSS